MRLCEKEIKIPFIKLKKGYIDYFKEQIEALLPEKTTTVRFVVTKTDEENYHCELGLLDGLINDKLNTQSIFDKRIRKTANNNQFNVAMIIPTGVQAEIGGDSGDGGAAIRLVASASDNLITHPNTVNGADLNELPENGLYVEGSVLTRLLMGTVGLQRVNGNRILLIVEDREEEDQFFCDLSINSASAARVALGVDCETVKLNPKFTMKAFTSLSGRAVGRIENIERLIELIESTKEEYDAFAISSIINVPMDFHGRYFYDDAMINPWGGVEAMLTHTASLLTNMPTAHAPMVEKRGILNLEISSNITPKKAAEAVSSSNLHCVLKGLHKSPKIITDAENFNHNGVMSVEDISCLIIPERCVGLPTLAAIEQGIPIIAIKDKTNLMQNDIRDLVNREDKYFEVNNYLEAVGVMTALKAGISVDTVMPEVHKTIVHRSEQMVSKVYFDEVGLNRGVVYEQFSCTTK